jgi:Protein of unknown function (DUF3500)
MLTFVSSLYRSVKASAFNSEQKQILLTLIKAFNEYLPDVPLAGRMELVEKNLDETYFTWIGGLGDNDP